MDSLTHFLATHWFSLLLLGVALGLGVLLLRSRRRQEAWSLPLLLFTSAFALASAGGLALRPDWGMWLAVGAAAVLIFMLVLVVATGRWSATLGYCVGALILLGLGGFSTVAASESLSEVGKAFLSLEIGQPGWLTIWGPVAIPLWLLPLGFVPFIIWISYHSLAGLGSFRRWLAIGLRCSLIILLTLALSEVRIRHQNETVTVLFLIDRSLSVPPEYPTDAPPDTPQARVDQRWERIKRFINDAVEKRGPGHERDKAGVIVFGRRPRLELPPSDAPRFNFTEVASNIDSNYTDLGAAIKLALASFPEGTGKRIVLFSDGNENLGSVEEQARIAKLNGVQIDVVPLAAGYRNESEVMVQSVEAPALTEQGARLPIRVLVRSFNPNPVIGMLTLRQLSDGQSEIVGGKPIRVRIRPGLNSVPFPTRQLAGKEQSYTYEAVFQPEAVEMADGQKVRRYLPGEDRVENNRATTHVVALGQRRILIIEPAQGDHDLLVQHLKELGNNKYKVHNIIVDQLPQNKADLAVLLSNYDCVILANVPASDVAAGDVPVDKIPAAITEDQQEVIRSNTHDQGCGLIMIGGPNGFGAGGWQGTPVEKALPVDCDIKSMKVQGKGGLVLIMHGCELADGNRWEREIAKLAIRKLSPMDMIGVIHWGDFSTAKWHIPFQEIGTKRDALISIVDKMNTGDMSDVNPALQKSYDVLTDPKNELATRHIIFISDGDHWEASQPLLAKIRASKTTCTTVCITTHGPGEVQKMSKMAAVTGGRSYNVKNAKALPSIYIKETRLVSQSFIYENKRGFRPTLHYKSGPTDKLPDQLEPLFGFVRTTLKQSPLVEMPIEGPPAGDQHFPLLAYWHYGLGKAVAFTSDARSLPAKERLGWDRRWAESDMYLKFWEQVVDWSLRAVETGKLTMTTEYRDGKVKIIVDARDEKNRPMTDLKMRGAVTSTAAKVEDPRKLQLKFEQKNSGLYEAEFKAEEAGSFFVTAQPTRKVVKKNKDGKEIEVEEGIDSVRAGVTIPYSPEFADLESNTPLLKKICEMTGGKMFLEKPRDVVDGKLIPDYDAVPEDAKVLPDAVRSNEAFRPGLPRFRSLQPIWFWLALVTAILLFLDVAVRRIAIEPMEVAGAAQRVWGRLRRRAAVADTTPQFLDRLKSRKAQISEALDKSRAAQRFDAGDAPIASAPAGADAPTEAPKPLTRKPTAQPQISPDKEQEAVDYASRLLKAKKRVWEERDKEKDK